ncbi:MAG: tetratricopeptide repeat protein [Myxococcota bacterium]
MKSTALDSPQSSSFAPGNGSGAPLLAFYDLSASPTSFDFVTFLARAEAARRASGATCFRVVFVPAEGTGFWDREPFDAVEKRERLRGLLSPLCRLYPACIGAIVCASRKEASALGRTRRAPIFPTGYRVRAPVPDAYQWAHAVAALACGEELPAWTAPPESRRWVRSWLAERARGRRVIVISLREAPYYPECNSDLKAWGSFGRELNPEQFFVVIVRDTATATAAPPPELRGLACLAEASVDPCIRAALYVEAEITLTVASGPMQLIWLQPECACLVFKLPNLAHARATPVPIRSMGIEPGCPAPMGRPHQRIVWEPDSLEAIRRAFRAWLAQRKRPVPQSRSTLDPPLVIARRLRDTGRLDAALRIYGHLSHRDSRDGFPLYAACLAELRRPEVPKPVRAWRAGRLFLRARSLQPEWGDAAPHEQMEWALCHEAWGRRRAAERAYTAVLAKDPQQSTALTRLGILALGQGRVEAALDHLRAAIEIDPYAVDAHYALGRALSRLGRDDHADRHFRRAALYDPSHRRAASAARSGTVSIGRGAA